MKADICGSETLAKKSAARGHPGLYRGPLDLQSNALPLSYTPSSEKVGQKRSISHRRVSRACMSCMAKLLLGLGGVRT